MHIFFVFTLPFCLFPLLSFLDLSLGLDNISKGTLFLAETVAATFLCQSNMEFYKICDR